MASPARPALGALSAAAQTNLHFPADAVSSPSIHDLKKKKKGGVFDFANEQGPPAEEGEMPNGASASAAADDDRPLAERLVDKSWKARKQAKDELATLLDDAESGDAPVFAEYGTASCAASPQLLFLPVSLTRLPHTRLLRWVVCMCLCVPLYSAAPSAVDGGRRQG